MAVEEDGEGDNDELDHDGPEGDWMVLDDTGHDVRPDEDVIEIAQGMVVGFAVRPAESLFTCSLQLPRDVYVCLCLLNTGVHSVGTMHRIWMLGQRCQGVVLNMPEVVIANAIVTAVRLGVAACPAAREERNGDFFRPQFLQLSYWIDLSAKR